MQSQIYDILYAWLSQVWMGNNFQFDITPLDQEFEFGDNSYQWIVGEQTLIPPAVENVNFGSYRIMGYVPKGIPGRNFTYIESLDKFNEQVFNYQDAIVSLNLFSVDQTAEDMINQIILSATSQNVLDLFDQSGFSIRHIDEANNLTNTISGRNIKRFQTNILIGTVATYTSYLERIVNVPVTGEVSNNNINTVVT